MSTANVTEASEMIGSFFPDEQTVMSVEETAMTPILRWGIVLAGVSLMLFCFICVTLFILHRRRRSHIAPQDWTFSASRDDQLTVAEENSIDEESAQRTTSP